MFIIIGGDGKEYGPVTEDQVRTWIAAGRANLDTQAKAVGSEEWRRVGDHPEFSGAAVPPIVSGSGRVVPAADASTLAGRGARTVAALINGFFYLLCIIPGSTMMSRQLLERNPELARGVIPRMEDLDLSAVMTGMMWMGACLMAAFALQSILLAVRGQNLGKMLLGVRVVRADNSLPAGFVHGALLRFILPVVAILGLNMLTFVLGYIFLLVDYGFMFRQDGRCLHDLIAGTKVIKA